MWRIETEKLLKNEAKSRNAKQRLKSKLKALNEENMKLLFENDDDPDLDESEDELLEIVTKKNRFNYMYCWWWW